MRALIGTALFALSLGAGCGAARTTNVTTVSTPGAFPRDPAPPLDTHDSAVPNDVAFLDVPAPRPRLREVVTLGHAEAEPMYAQPSAPGVAPGAGPTVNVTVINQMPAYGYGSYGTYGAYGGFAYGRYGSAGASGVYAQPTYQSSASARPASPGYTAPANPASTYVPRGGHVGTIEGPVYTTPGGGTTGSSWNRGTTSAPSQVGGNWPAVRDAGPRPMH